MMKKYYSVITTIGAARLADAVATGTLLDITEMAVGDGGGVLPRPNPEQTALINEVFREPLNRLSITSAAANVVEAEMIIPAQAGGWWLREVALFASDGACIAVGNMPESYKPLTTDGSSRTAAVRMQLTVSSTDNIELIIDPAVVIATVQDVNAAKNEAKDYTDDAISELDESIKNAIAHAIEGAIRDAWEQDNPVGSSRLFNQNVNPNERWPWSTWEYAGEHLTIRTAKADGSDVGTQGGSDTVTIARDNLPAESLGLKGFTDTMDFGVMRTQLSGKHAHGGVPKRNSNYELGGNNRVFFDPYDSAQTDEAGEHDHVFTIPAHNHALEGETDKLGQSQALNIVERHKLQMLWHRVA
ncbi:phage tail protein [Serratia marcescens]|uniref:phage tail protein n=1 Tax=Serratia TaxID=613 RepID=UPI0015738239|nr:phage tail protein [Serratia marcescens]NSM20472.1 phage tail protein [Serratia marcescens]NSM47731.1 phage tail protein [Serratia marcescens]